MSIIIIVFSSWNFSIVIINDSLGYDQALPQGFSLKTWVGWDFSQGFSLKKMGGAGLYPPHPVFKGKTVGTRLGYDDNL